MAHEKPGEEPNGCQKTKEGWEAASNMRKDDLDSSAGRVRLPVAA